MNLTTLMGFLILFFSTASFAESWSIHISEDNVNSTEISTDKSNSSVFYVSKNSPRGFNPYSDMKDAYLLGQSIEFEMYEINEKRSSHIVFEAGAGVCRGYQSGSGVYVTDSTTYYVYPVNKKEYYKNIAIGNVSSGEGVRNVQYVPVFYIRDEKLAENVQKEDSKQGKKLASHNIRKRSDMLSQVICKSPK